MNTRELVAELGAKLGMALQWSEAGTCRILFDDDAVDFEQSGNLLYVMADMASASGREDAYGRLLSANCLGAESGGACIGLDAARNVFTLHIVIRDDASYESFETELMLFLKALRYWKEWLALPPAPVSTAPTASVETAPLLASGMLRI